MPNRILRDGILSSERVALLNWQEEVFYRRLMSVVDDFGRYHANPKLLRASCYPLLIDKVSDADVGKWLTSCVTAALVSVYPASDGKRYLQLMDFRQQARAEKSKFPQMQDGCVADAAQVHGKCVADAPVYGVVVEGVVETDAIASAASAKPPRAAKKCPATFDLTAELLEFAARFPAVDCQAETAKLRDHTFKNPISDWPGAWRNRIRRASESASAKPRALTGETAWQRSQRERMEQFAPGVAAKAPGLKPALNIIEMERGNGIAISVGG